VKEGSKEDFRLEENPVAWCSMAREFRGKRTG
jgi:hypothetical protein